MFSVPNRAYNDERYVDEVNVKSGQKYPHISNVKKVFETVRSQSYFPALFSALKYEHRAGKFCERKVRKRHVNRARDVSRINETKEKKNGESAWSTGIDFCYGETGIKLRTVKREQKMQKCGKTQNNAITRKKRARFNFTRLCRIKFPSGNILLVAKHVFSAK